MKGRAGQEETRSAGASAGWSVMYPAHFRMTENPFTADADAKFLCSGKACRFWPTWFGDSRRGRCVALAPRAREDPAGQRRRR